MKLSEMKDEMNFILLLTVAMTACMAIKLFLSFFGICQFNARWLFWPVTFWYIWLTMYWQECAEADELRAKEKVKAEDKGDKAPRRPDRQ